MAASPRQPGRMGAVPAARGGLDPADPSLRTGGHGGAGSPRLAAPATAALRHRGSERDVRPGHGGKGIAMTVNIDELGPVDWIVVEFPGTKLTGEIAPILKDYVDRGLIKVLDLLFLTKDADGSLEASGAAALVDAGVGGPRGYEKDVAVVLREQALAAPAATIGPGGPAARRVWENLWAAPFGAAVGHAGGQ